MRFAGAGLSTSSTAIGPRSNLLTSGYGCVFEASYADGKGDEDVGGDWTIIAGRMPSLLSRGCSPTSQPMLRPVNPLEGKTTDRRAGCGRSASPVRREGEPGTQPALPTPIVPAPTRGASPGP